MVTDKIIFFCCLIYIVIIMIIAGVVKSVFAITKERLDKSMVTFIKTLLFISCFLGWNNIVASVATLKLH